MLDFEKFKIHFGLHILIFIKRTPKQQILPMEVHHMTCISSIIYSLFIIIVLLLLYAFTKLILPTLKRKDSFVRIKLFGIEIEVKQ